MNAMTQPALTTLVETKAATQFADYLEPMLLKLKLPPEGGYRERTMNLTIEDEDDSGSSQVDCIILDNVDAEILLKALRTFAAQNFSDIEAACKEAYKIEDGYGDPDKDRYKYNIFRDGFFAARMFKSG